MLTIRRDSEAKLIETLNSIQATRASWRAMAFNFSLLKEHTSITDFKKVAYGIITNELSEYEGIIFFMNDEDIIVVGKGITKKDYDVIAKEINVHISEEFLLKMVIPFSMLYDLGVNWDILNEITHDKFKVVDAARANKPKQAPAIAEPVKAKETAKAAASNEGHKRNTILIVEDDPLSIFITKKALDDDYIVHTVENGQSAFAAYVKYKPDVVFLDIGLPDISGHEVLKKIILDIDPAAYVVMLSANNGSADIMHALQLGSQGFVSKPFSKSKLIQYITQAPTYRAS